MDLLREGGALLELQVLDLVVVVIHVADPEFRAFVVGHAGLAVGDGDADVHIFRRHKAFLLALSVFAVMLDFLVDLVGLGGGIALVHDLADGLGHAGGAVGLEDVAAHVHAVGALLDGAVGHLQGVQLRQLLAAGDDDGDRAGRRYPLKTVVVVALDDVGAVLRQHPGRQQEEALRPLHLLADGHHAQRRDAVAGAGVRRAAQQLQRAGLARRADEGLHRHAVRVHADGVLHVAGEAAAVGHVVVKHGGVVGQAHALGRGDRGRNARADGALSAHQHIHIGGQRRNDQIDPLQARRGTHDVPVVKGQHHGVAGLRPEDTGEAIPHAPVAVGRALDVEALLGGGGIQMVVVGGLVSDVIRHGSLLAVGGGVAGGVPQAEELLVPLGDVHLEARRFLHGEDLAHHAGHDLHALGLQEFHRVLEEHQHLHHGGGAAAVDHHEGLVARLEIKAHPHRQRGRAQTGLYR